MFKIAVCDDDLNICSLIENALLSYQNEFDFCIDIEVFYSAKELFSYIKNGNSFDLIYLDLEIPNMTGLELGAALRCYMDDYFQRIRECCNS